MKNLTEARKKKSIKKWEKFILWVDNEVEVNYRDEFFNGCGFCDAAEQTYLKSYKYATCWNEDEDTGDFIYCKYCSLHKDDICRSYIDNPSEVIMAIQCAGNREFKFAKIHAEKVLKAIKRTRVDKKEKVNVKK